MAVNDLQCPNCGAQVNFAGRTQTTCSFCRSQLYFSADGIKVSSVLSDLLEGKPAPAAGVDIDQIQQLTRAGKKIEAIKLVREQTGLGLKEARDAVEAIERGETVALTLRATPAAHGVSGIDLDQINELLLQNKKIEAIKLYREQTGLGLKEARDAIDAIEATGWPSTPGNPAQAVKSTVYRSPHPKSSVTGLLGCLPMLLFFGLCAGFIMLSSQVAFRAWGPLDQVMKILNNNPQVTQVFGQPLTVGPFITGSISGGDTSSSAHFSVPLYGPQHSGTLRVSGSWRRGTWDISVWVLYDSDDGEEQTIYITQKVK
jgi:ribosomal protein L7/L12